MDRDDRAHRHKKLEEAAANGTTGDDETRAAVVEAIRSARSTGSSAPPDGAEKSSDQAGAGVSAHARA